ncbi:MAG: hypothetical protein NNA23_12950 [Nitrospira sp.]|nr:hypothetical protein [Nitrospira sp.]
MGVGTAYTVNELNQYVTVGQEVLAYDANGNLTSGLGLTLQYDAQNRLISAATASNVVMLAYDGRNRCVRRTVVTQGGGSVVYLVWGHAQSEQWGLLEERGASGEVLGRYVHGPGIDELVAGLTAGGGVMFYHQDHLNSTVAVTDESGALLEQYRYDVFGKPFFFAPDGRPRAESAYGVRFLFTGREWLSSLGLYDYRHRVYSPSLGRFLQPDPIDFAAGDVNLYRYCANKPLKFSDPSGLLRWSIVRNFVAGAAMGASLALLVVIAAPVVASVGAAALTAAGVSAATAGTLATGAVSAGLLVAAGYGAWTTGVNIYENAVARNWDKVAFDVGTLVGGVAVGVGGRPSGGRALAEGMMGRPSPAPNTVDLRTVWHYEWSNRYRAKLGPPSLKYFATGPTPFSGGTAATLVAGGIGSTLYPSESSEAGQ